jgi:hypothetical protein
MKTRKRRTALVAALAGLLVSSTATASVVTWIPTDSNVNILPTATPISSGTLGFFDNNNTTYDTSGSSYNGSSGYLAVNPAGDTLSFSPNPVGQTTGTFQVTNAALIPASTYVTNGPYFTLAYNAGSGFQQPNSVTCNAGSSSCTLTWDVGGSAVGVDLATVEAPSSVPLPAAGWLFLSGLVGLVSVGRHSNKKAAA